MEPRAMLEIDGLAKRYGDVEAIAAVGLAVHSGQVLGFLGPNGAGKTTTMRSVLGLVRPDRGTINFDGRPITLADRRRIGYLPQERGLYPTMRVLDQVAYFGRLGGLGEQEAVSRAEALLDEVGVAARADAKVQELSVGNQQRVQLAVALVHRPSLLVLDEPFAGLDPEGVHAMRRVLEARSAAGAAVVFSSHQLDLVQDICRDVVIVAAGRTVAAGSVVDIRGASKRRLLTVRIAGGGSQTWRHDPSAGIVVDEGIDGWTIELASGVDALDIVRQAEVAGELVSWEMAPPSLEARFLELVAGA